jgi:WD40 repeat protein
MKKEVAVGLIAGAAGLVLGATTIATKVRIDKIAKEIRSDISEHSFTSPNGDNTVTLWSGSSKTGNGLTYIEVVAKSNNKECNLIAFAKKGSNLFTGEWADNEHFTLTIGSGKRKQYCDVTFVDGKITEHYYLWKKTL